jgi:hypothetical protein
MIHLKLDKEKKDQLVTEFKECKSIKDKIDFWVKQLKIPYYLWPHIPEEEYIEFKLTPENKKEIEEINNLSLNQYKERTYFSSSRKVLDIEELKLSFNKGLEESANKNNYIDF